MLFHETPWKGVFVHLNIDRVNRYLRRITVRHPRNAGSPICARVGACPTENSIQRFSTQI